MQKSLTAVVLTILLALTSFAQTPPFGERVDVSAVLIDTVVTDSRGNQILGLTKDDFLVTEDGVQQTIDSVDYFSTRRLLTDEESKQPFQVEQIKEERYFVFFLDKPEGGELFEEQARGRAAITKFIDRDLGAKDLAAIVGHDVRLKIYTDFTSDKRQLKKALADSATWGRGVLKPNASGPSIVRELGEDRIVKNTGTVYQALEAVAEAVRPIRARKNLILFSAGIREPSEQVRGGVLLNESRYYEPMIQALNAANVTVYSKNLMTTPPTDPMYHQTLERLAMETNGQYWRNALSFEPALEAVSKESGGYYLITYRSNRPHVNRGFQKVDVKVANAEFRVKSRAGYSYGE